MLRASMGETFVEYVEVEKLRAVRRASFPGSAENEGLPQGSPIKVMQHEVRRRRREALALCVNQSCGAPGATELLRRTPAPLLWGPSFWCPAPRQEILSVLFRGLAVCWRERYC